MRKRTLTDVLLGLSIFLLVLTFLAGPAHAQFGSGTESKVIASAKFQLKSGSKTEGVIQVTATVVSKYHIYSVTQKKGGPLPTRISVVKPEEGVILGAWTPDKKPEIHHYDVYQDSMSKSTKVRSYGRRMFFSRTPWRIPQMRGLL